MTYVEGARHIPIHNFAQVRVVHHWVSHVERPLEGRGVPTLLQRQLARLAPRIAREPNRGPGRVA